MNGLQNAYLESRIAGAAPLELTSLLYQAALAGVRDALHCLQAGDIAGRSRHISRTIEIVSELQGALDFSQGGELAGRLAALYEYVLDRLLQANLRQAAEPLGEAAGILSTLAEAWEELARKSEPEPGEYGAWQPAGGDSLAAAASHVWSY
jgi:flagellar protein FliS